MEIWKGLLVFTILLSVLGRIESVGLGMPCSATTPCTNTADHVCETTCKVKANGVATGCTAPSTNCPTNAACQASGGNFVCRCNTNYMADSNGLCVSLIGMVCANNAECTAALANTQCNIMRPCTKGRCACTDGYTGTAGTACTAAPAAPKGHGEACSGTDTCMLTTSCQSGTCQCTTQGHTYKAAIQMCTDKALFQETCTAVTDCHAYTAGNAACSSTCSCASGYIADGTTQICRAPHRDEACQSTPACAVHARTSDLLPGETSSVASTCSAGSCTCGTGISTVDREFSGVCYKLCLNPYTSTLKSNGDQCTQFNECQSKVCYQCPEDATPVCHSAECTSQQGNTATTQIMSTTTLAGLLIVLKLFI